MTRRREQPRLSRDLELPDGVAVVTATNPPGARPALLAGPRRPPTAET